jgi:hypothetical protein
MQPVTGHPYVLASVEPDGYGRLIVRCHCRACGDTWTHLCQYPQKAPLWVHRYSAQHHHGVPGLRARFAYLYHTGLQRLRAGQ